MLKEKILKREKTCGTHLSMGEGYVADVYGKIGYDFVWIDTEHSLMDYRELNNCITIIKAHKVSAVVRVQMDNLNHTKKVLEMGPDGIIFPNVDTVEYLDKCMRSTLYPLEGTRGFGPIGATSYGMDDVNEYIKNQDKLCRFIQIESKKAVENLPEMIKNPYVDGFIIGPCDLSGSIGKLNDVFCEENIKLIKDIIKIVKDNGKYVGLSTGSTDIECQKFWYDLGIDMLSSGVDFEYVASGAKKNFEQLKSIIDKK